MNRQHMIRVPALTACGLLVAASVSATVAGAQTHGIRLASNDAPFQPAGSEVTFEPTGTETVTSFYGINTAPPTMPGTVQGYQDFDVKDAGGNVIGSFEAFRSDNAGNEELLVTQVLSGTPSGDGSGVPAVGSIFDNLSGGPTFANDYSDWVSPTGGDPTAFDTLTTILGTSTSPSTYHASAHEDPATNAVGPDGHPINLPLPNGDAIQADPDDPATITAVNGLSPVAVAVQGQDQVFDVVNADGDVVGKFTGVWTTTGDGAGGYSEAVLVTGIDSGTVGTAEGDVPGVGSVFNILFYFNPNIYTMYSEIVGPDGPTTANVASYLYGIEYNTPTAFDGVTGLTDGTNLFDTIPFSNGQTIAPDGPETYSGINGLPPGNEAVQGYQTFDLQDGGSTVGSFDADITTFINEQGDQDEALLVTSGTVASLPQGSWIEYDNLGFGFATLYTDIVGTGPDGANTITDTLITPLGDINIPTSVDAALQAMGLDFFDPLVP